MDTNAVLHIGRRALETALLVSAPVLLVALVVGVLTAMFQAVTSIRDMTLGVVIKIGAVGVTVLIFGGWMMQISVDFAAEVFNIIQGIGAGR